MDFEPAISQKKEWYAFEYEEDVRRTRDSDGRCAEDGVVIPLESLIKDSAASDGVLESLTVTPTSLDAIVLARSSPSCSRSLPSSLSSGPLSCSG